MVEPYLSNHQVVSCHHLSLPPRHLMYAWDRRSWNSSAKAALVAWEHPRKQVSHMNSQQQHGKQIKWRISAVVSKAQIAATNCACPELEWTPKSLGALVKQIVSPHLQNSESLSLGWGTHVSLVILMIMVPVMVASAKTWVGLRYR